MDAYREILKHIIYATVKSHIIVASVLVVIAIICFLLKKKFNTEEIVKWSLIIAAVTCLKAGAQTVPAIIDLKQNSFVIIEDGRLVPYKNSNPRLDLIAKLNQGEAYAIDKSGYSVGVCGTYFFDALSDEDTQEIYGDVVYAKHSRQLIAVEKDSENIIENK